MTSPICCSRFCFRAEQTALFNLVFSMFRTCSVLVLPTNSVVSGDEGIRTPDLRRAKAALSQLSYIPGIGEVGLSGLEPETSPLSEARSNQLS